MKNLNMRMKLIILAIIVGVIPMIVVGVMTFVSARNELETSVLKTNTVYATLTKDQLTSFFQERKGDGNVIAGSDSVKVNMDILTSTSESQSEKDAALMQMDQYLTMTLNEYGYTNIYVTDNEGTIIYAVEMKESIVGAELASRTYIRGALNGSQTWSEPFFSDVINDNMMALGNPIYSPANGDIIGTLNILIDQAMLNGIVHQGTEELGVSGDSYLVGADGLLYTETKLGLYRENSALRETIDTTATQLLKNEIMDGNRDFTYTGLYEDYLGNPVYGSLGVVEIGDQYLGLIIEIDESEAFAGLAALRTTTFIIIALLIFGSILMLLIVARTITAPLSVVVENANQLSVYNLSSDVNQRYLSRRDEIGTMANSVQTVILNLRDLLGDVAKNSEQLAASAQALTATSEQSSVAAEEVAETINEIAKGASEQAENTMTGSEKLSELSGLIEEDMIHIAEMNKATKSVSDLVNEGLEISDQLALRTQDNSNAAGVVYESILKTNESSAKIGEASSVIASIAEQTNLLALNAAIEAARAGEAGKGFSVVAEEIRKLAEQSTESTQSIDNMVATLKQDADIAVKKMEEAGGIVREQEASVKRTIEKYNEISSAMKEAEGAVEILRQASSIMEGKKDDVQSVLENLSAVAEQNAASTEEASAAMEEQTASIEEIANASEGLSQLSMELQTLIEKFTF